MAVRALTVTPLVALLALTVGACRCAPITHPGSRDLAVPDRVDFGDCTTSSSVSRMVAITNRAAGTAYVQLQVFGPFSIQREPALEVPGGASAEAVVAFRPTASGPMLGALHVLLDDGVLAIQLTGNGVPECSSDDTCQSSTFDSIRQECVLAAASDGVVCQSRCVTGGQCHGGTCYGQSQSCDDRDACTVDACSETGACLHLPRPCPVTAACKVAACDPTSGACSARDVLDGTPCGPTQCATALVCIAGECVARPVPGVDGSLDCRYQDLAIEFGTACAVTRRGDVRCWGRAAPIIAAGGLTSSLELQPPGLVFDGGERLDRVAVAGSVCAWGSSIGRCSSNSPLPDRAALLENARSVDISQTGGTCVVSRVGSLTCFDDTTDGGGIVLLDAGVVEARGGLRDGVALLVNGTLVGWRSGADPQPVAGPDDVVSLPLRGCAIDATGGLWCQSSPSRYQLMIDGGVFTAGRWKQKVCVVEDGGSRCLPSEILPWTDATKLAGDNDNLCALRRDGTIECLGSNSSGVLGVDELYLSISVLTAVGGPARRISIGSKAVVVGHAAGLRVIHRTSDTDLPDLSTLDAEHFAVGGADIGVLTPAGAARRLVFVPPSAPSRGYWLNLPWDIPDVTHMAARSATGLGSEHLLLSEGGQLRLSSIAPLVETVRLERPFGPVTQLAIGGSVTCAARVDGGVDCVSLATPDAGVERVDLPGRTVSVSMNDSAACAVVNGGLWCWSPGQPAARVSNAPAALRGVAMGKAHTCVLFGVNGVACRGSNREGALGHHMLDSPTDWLPIPIDESIVSMSSGPDAATTCVLTHTGRAVCWGDNRSGQLGREPLLSSDVPIKITD